MKIGPHLVIDFLLTHQLVSFPEFWSAVPVGLLDDKVDDIKKSIADATKAALTDDCIGCTTIKNIIAPVHNLIWRRIGSLLTEHPENQLQLMNLITLIAKKRGYRPKPISVYYKDETGKSMSLTL